MPCASVSVTITLIMAASTSRVLPAATPAAAAEYLRQVLLAAMQQVDAQAAAESELGMQGGRAVDAGQHRRRIGRDRGDGGGGHAVAQAGFRPGRDHGDGGGQPAHGIAEGISRQGGIRNGL